MHRHALGITLLELMISIIIIGMIAFGLFSIDLFSRSQVIGADKRAKLQNEVSYTLDHMTKHIGMAIGDFSNPAIKAYTDNKGIRIRVDDNPANGRIDSTDYWIAYRHENIGTTDSEIRYYPDASDTENPTGSHETIARKIVRGTPGLEFWINFDAGNRLLDNYIEVKITARWQPDQSASAKNPEVTMRTRISMPAVSTH